MTRYIIALLVPFIIAGCSDTVKSPKKGRNINGIPILEYTIEKTYPHSIQSYTEGLLFHNGKLYESTGSPEDYPDARSVIGEVNLKTGDIDVKVEIDRKKYFGEGILFLNDKLYQLTYRNQTGFIYNAKDFRLIGSFRYSNREGWGMTTDGRSVIMSDGTNYLTFWEPDSLKEIKKLNITLNGSSALYANELEYIREFIYANIWTTHFIAKIDPLDGRIVGLLDLTPLFLKARKENPLSEATNGIAYDPDSDRIFVTGKFWPYIFGISFPH